MRLASNLDRAATPLDPADVARAPVTTPRVRRALLIDDEEAIRRAFAKYLRANGWEVQAVDGGQAALDALAADRFTVALCDIHMPGMSGLDFLPHALVADPELAVVMLTGTDQATTATEALQRGALDYLIKPIDLPALDAALERALLRRRMTIEQRAIDRRIRAEVAERTAELEREQVRLRDVSTSAVQALVNAMEAKDVYLRGHSQRVAMLAASIAEELGLPAETVEHVRFAARLQDVGKIGVRESVMNKPGPLDPDEIAHVRAHVGISIEILRPLVHLGPVLRFVAEHHEHWDGSGYPRGLAGEEISIGGRILAAADAYEAATSRRAYREALAPERALEVMESLVGRLLDPRVHGALATVVQRRRALVFLDA